MYSREMPSRCLLAIAAVLALAIGVVVAPAFARTAKSPGTVCNLVRASAIPKNVDHGCHPQGSRSAVFGSGFLAPTPSTHAFKITLARLAGKPSIAEFKRMTTTLAASTKGKIATVKVGSWARAVSFAGAGGTTFVEVGFIVNGYSCVEVYANPDSSKEPLVVARVVAAKLS
jgi:hypothetical protein